MSENSREKRSFAFYKLYRFDEYKETLLTQLEFAIPDNPSNLTRIIKQTDGPFNKFNVYFDEKVNKGGYSYFMDNRTNIYEEIVFDYYYRKNRFKAYVFKEKNYIIFDTSYKIVDAFLNSIGGLISLNGKKPKSKCDEIILLEKIAFDPLEISHKLNNIHGAWWKQDNVANISSQATFGRNVDNSIPFQQLKKGGAKITSLNFPFVFGEKDYSLILSTNGSLAILNSTTENDALCLVTHFIEKLII